MRVLVACEFSGTVREAFAKLGHDAWSCDLLPTEIPSDKHIQGDVTPLLNEHWDLLIAHPPCTYLSYAATKYWNQPGREELRQEAMKFFMLFINAPFKYVCVENPVGLPNTIYRKPDQIIHPYYWGEPHKKRTCLWLKNLPKLKYDKEKIVEPEPIYIDKTGKKRYFTDANHGGKTRSVTFKCVAEQFALQWGELE